MIQSLTIHQLMSSAEGIIVLDVRTPAEFSKGHIPGALNLPLFGNEERVLVGTTYKQVGREAAILQGFDLTGNKWSDFIRQALLLAPEKKLVLHCWRGGMRSEAMAWALNLYGFEVSLIIGGYKSYRRWAMQQFERKRSLLMLGGMTGSGKTDLLKSLKQQGEQIIDLEDLAAHQGSAYGSLNCLVQPSQEQFENELALQLSRCHPDRITWVEDESINIGRRQIPQPFWKQMQAAVVIDLQIPFEQRVTLLAKAYGVLDKTFLLECTRRIHKRLGPAQTKLATTAIEENRMEDFIRAVLVYYDKTYRKSLHTRPAQQIVPLPLEEIGLKQQSLALLHFSETILPQPQH